MRRYAVRLAPDARLQALTIVEWWRKKAGSSEVFEQELQAALGRLETIPTVGPPYRQSRGRMVRRILMPRTSHHVYFEIIETESIVRGLSIWHTARGQGPPLPTG
jgi:plasmid stabilization system protein ParE